MDLKIGIENALPFIGKENYSKLLTEAEGARKTLLDGTGRGNDFIDWLDFNREITGDLDDIIETAKNIRDTSQVLVVIGVGGSYLGAKAAIDFVYSPNYNQLPKNTPEIYFAGNYMSADAINELITIIGNRDFSVNVISKSGTTTEPAVAFRIFRRRLEEKYGRMGAAARIYATTDKSRGALRRLSEEKGYKTFVVPDNVGGRYSVFSPVGLLPLAVAGMDIKKMVYAVNSALELCKTAPKEDNPAMIYAAIRNGMYRGGKTVEVIADFEPALRMTCEWWKQLYGESEGKEHKALFPASVDYSADLHSMGQFIQDGERCMFETFLKVTSPISDIAVPAEENSVDELDYLAGKKLSWANSMVHRAVEKAHFDGGVPNLTITVPDRSAESFAVLTGVFMFACGVSGYMLDINPFDQPGVEEYKRNMYRMLGKPGFAE